MNDFEVQLERQPQLALLVNIEYSCPDLGQITLCHECAEAVTDDDDDDELCELITDGHKNGSDDPCEHCGSER